MASESTTGTIIGSIQVLIGVLGLLLQGANLLNRYRIRLLVRRQSECNISFIDMRVIGMCSNACQDGNTCRSIEKHCSGGWSILGSVRNLLPVLHFMISFN
jgi:hypothetical protein